MPPAIAQLPFNITLPDVTLPDVTLPDFSEVFQEIINNIWARRLAIVLVICIIAIILFFFVQYAFFAILSLIGFGILGPIAGSMATVIQAGFVGGAVVAGSLFACLQSIAMGGPLVAGVIVAGALVVGIILLIVGVIVGAALGIDIFAYLKCLFGWAADSQCSS